MHIIVGVSTYPKPPFIFGPSVSNESQLALTNTTYLDTENAFKLNKSTQPKVQKVGNVYVHFYTRFKSLNITPRYGQFT